MKNMILIDGNSLMYRAYYGTALKNLMQNSKGEFTNAIYAFANMLHGIMQRPYDNILIAFDKGKHTFRHEMLKDYKGGRSPMPDEFRSQIPNLKRYIDILNVKRYEMDLYEADDIIGTMAKSALELGYHVDIYSSDKDMLQLVNDNVTLHMIRKGITDVEDFTPKHIYEVYGLSNSQMIDLKALMGDPSDNLKGVPGVGEKTAIKLLNEYKTLENVLDNASSIKGKLGEKIASAKEDAILCKKMVTINTSSPVLISVMDTVKKEPNNEELIEFFKEMEFHSFLKRIIPSSQDEFNYQIINDSSLLEEILIDDSALIVELDDYNYHRANILGFGISNSKGSFFIPNEVALSSFSFGDFLASKDIKKICFDLKKCLVSLNKEGYNLDAVTFDLLLAAYIANPKVGKEDFKIICDNFSYSEMEYDENVYGKTYKKNPELEVYAKHIARKAYALRMVKDEVINELKKNDQYKLFTDIEMPLAHVLAKMEIAGMKVSKEELEKQKSNLSKRINDLEDEIFSYCPNEFNISSTKQLGEMLFEELKLPVIKKTKTGYSTDSDVLEHLISVHPIISLVIEYRELTKLYSTYIEGIKNALFEDGKVHTIFKQALTATGRLSSIEPNLQNIPVRTNEGREIRKMFVPTNDYLLSADYSQIELRVLAHMANENTLIEAFNNDEDIHERTAKEIFKKEEITKIDRRRAKVVNFGIIYGMSAWGLSNDANMTPKEAKMFIDKYFETFPGIKTFMDQTVSFAMENGYVTTIMNRRRYIPELKSNVYMQKEFGKRTAMNAPIQGSAADIIKIAMIKLDKEMTSKKLKSKIISQVHDELIFDVCSEELDVMIKLVKKVMEEAIKLSVPLKIEYGYGNNWMEVK